MHTMGEVKNVGGWGGFALALGLNPPLEVVGQVSLL